ncbi:hypothetical protein [Glaciimonas sp. PAMC28666]|uniref:hypothetical protein n=1 Tax=Glaciimonas sp. PAMC28666 TaxID=2807626 RepID=UPI00351C2E57
MVIPNLSNVPSESNISRPLRVLDVSALACMAIKTSLIDAKCACRPENAVSWQTVPPSLDEAHFEAVGTLREDPFVEPTFAEYHPAGTRYESPDAPIAPRFFPYNRCAVTRCVLCGRHYLRYTEAGGYFVDHRIRLLSATHLIDAAAPT